MHGDTILPSYNHYISVCKIGELYLGKKEMKNSPVPQKKREGSDENQVPKGGVRASWESGLRYRLTPDSLPSHLHRLENPR